MSCIYKVRTILAIFGLILIVISSVLYAFAIFRPETHLELVIERTYSDGSREYIVIVPIQISKKVVEAGREITYNDTLYLFIAWVVEPEDWTPEATVNIKVYKSVINESSSTVLITPTEHFPARSIKVIGRNNNKTLIYQIDNISPSDLLTAFGEYDLSTDGKYKIILTFNVVFYVTDPTGGVHIFNQSINYIRTFEVIQEKVYEISGEIVSKHQLSEESKSTYYRLYTSTTNLVVMALIMGIIGFVILLSAFLSPVPQLICRIKLLHPHVVNLKLTNLIS